MTTVNETMATCGAFPARLPAGSDSIEIERRRPAEYELVQRVAKGDMSAFDEIYRIHHRHVYSLCLRMTSNIAEAEDLTQEIFVHFFSKAGSFRGESAFATWLHRMTVNQVLMHFRKRSVRSELTTGDGEMPVQVTRGTENPRRMPVVDRIALDHAISQLPDGYRTVFILYDIEGFEHEEIGRMLGISTGTTKSQLHKARMRLRRLLERAD
jgi:RNA polymerase sigma-70 factor (ECF subfamily)